MRVLICGSRTWTDAEAIGRDLDALDPDRDIVIEGGARGADLLSKDQAHVRGIHVAEVRPLWDRYGRAAGHRRNGALVALLEPDQVWAYSHGTPGTQGTIDAARRARIPVRVVGVEVAAQ